MTAHYNAAHPDPIAVFPTTGQPIPDTALKEMLLSLRAYIQSDGLSGLQQHKAEVHELGNSQPCRG